MTKNKANADNSLMVDAKATRTISPPRRHVITNATDQELAKVSDKIIHMFDFLNGVCGFGYGF